MYVVLGASGNVGSKVAAGLLERGEKVRVVGRKAPGLEALRQRGAEVAAGDLGDAAFLARAFAGTHAAFTMIPPVYGAPDLLAAQSPLSENVSKALQASGEKRVVNLSSIGAELPQGTGPIVTLHRQEKRLDALRGVEVLHLRAGYFMENLLHSVAAARAMGFFPGQIEPNVAIEMVATADIAADAVAALVDTRWKGKNVVYVLGPAAVTMPAAAREVGRAIGKPDLAYRRVPDAAAEAGMAQAGFSPGVARLFTEMHAFLNRGAKVAGVSHRGPTTLSKFLEGALPRA